MKKLIKLMLALMLMLTVVPTSSWQVFATVGEETITIENKPEENTGNFSSEPTTTPEVTVVPESTPEITATPDVAPTPEVTPTGTPEVTVGKTTLVTIHQYIENDQVVNKEVIIEDLEIGQTIQAKDYALSIDGQTVVSTSNDSLLLQRSDNVIVYEYEIINSGQLLSYGSVIAGSSSNKKARSAKVGNDEPGAVFTTKQARWVDENSGIAAIDFTVKGNPVITGSDVLLIVDNSASMTNAGEDRWTPLQDSVKSFVNELYADVNGHTSTNKIGLLAFSSNADSYTDGFAGVNDLISVNAGGSAGKYSAKEYYNNILWNILSPYGNSTNYEVAFESAVKMFTDLDSDRPKFVIFLSDGVPNAGDYETAKMYSNQLKTSGVKVFSLGLRLAGEKPFNEFIEPLASNPTSQYAKDIQDLSQLQSIYRELAGQIKIAGTDAIITDYINSEIFEIASKPDSNVNYEASHGTVLIEGNKVVWNIGDITESEKKLTIYVKVSNVNASGLVYTNTSANNTYVDYANSSQTKDIPNASLTIGNKGSIQMNYYLVDKNGKLISQTGAPLDDFSKRVVLETEMFEKNGSSSLDFGTYHPYPPTTIVVDNVTYVYVASGEYNTSIDKVIILNPANKTENVYYGYKEYTVPNFIFYVQHYLENEDGSFTKQEMSSKYETPSVEGEILYAKNYVNEGYLTNYTFVENHKDSISQIENKINSQNNLLTVYYTRIMDNIEYKVNHVVNGKSTIDTVKGTIWRGESQKTIEVTSDSLKAKTDKDYAGYKIESIKDGKGNDVKFGDKVPNGTIITINYIKDETQTKDIHYTVKHVAGTQEINDDFTVTVQVLETKAPVQAIIAKTIIGYKVVQSDIDNAPTTVAEGEVITINYVKDETQTKEVSYEVTHKLPNGDSEVVTVKETVWINDADELKVTAESI
ncbi:vWA domain-containing protein, partial [Anaerorhabdus furcosa]